MRLISTLLWLLSSGCVLVFSFADDDDADADADTDADADADADPPPSCVPGEVDRVTCYNCGEQTRTCSPDGRWSDWSNCVGGGECEAGDYDYECCPQAPLARERICQDDCTWTDWSDCNFSDC